MKVDQYQQLARTTAIYPSKIVYPALGLIGECGEVVDKLFYTPYSEEEVLQEAGDLCWYMANLAYDCDSSLSKCIESDSFEIIENTFSGTSEIIAELLINLGAIAEIVKKALRDENGVFSNNRKKRIVEYIRIIHDTLTVYVSSVTGEPTLERSAILNVEKLKSRQERDVLKGDGDDR